MTQSTLEKTKAPVVLPVGGEDEDNFNYQEVWYPVFFVEDLDKNRPNSFTLLEEDIVIWWEEKTSQWRVFADKCPHRLAPLTEGRINEEGLLECPYHGWAFSGEGDCEVIPQQKENQQAQKSSRACAKAYSCKIEQDLLFVYAGNPNNADKTPIPIVDPLEEDKDKWLVLNTFRDIPYSALTLLENVLDSSHIPYTHHGSVGDRTNVSTVELEIISSNRQGFKGVWQEGPRKGKLGTQYTTFVAPNLMWHDLTSKQFGRTMTVVYATPISKGKCRLFARFPFQFSSKIPQFFIKLTPRWYSHLNQNAILEDDQIFLHYQERYLEKLGGSEKYEKACYLPTKADLYVTEFRQWINKFNAELFPHQTLPPTPPHDVLLERYHSHTENCSSCRQALKNIKKIRQTLLVFSAIIWSIIPLITLKVTSISPLITYLTVTVNLISILLYFYLGKIEQKFYQGQTIAPRNVKK
ncbi:Rieske 2Fe-2S domain-containing protein [Cyanobacterium sp. IPPAS B-1200]|uniref:aromatic ring-hydroxylating dioxygenase subunit alpha n=1 Tax=Cyanobacterium sp. IPPAS B-1200 TaxID=1562720 RepID=UPI0008527B0A|nr:Rieske 2Fe-2S domain-containing protein [Cyanobacterium sp. IPPAS B-1200]OEJ79322.1 cell death suppressor protein Lls1 [Cyanobacterium sp. IPPAS B-1200]